MQQSDHLCFLTDLRLSKSRKRLCTSECPATLETRKISFLQLAGNNLIPDIGAETLDLTPICPEQRMIPKHAPTRLGNQGPGPQLGGSGSLEEIKFGELGRSYGEAKPDILELRSGLDPANLVNSD